MSLQVLERKQLVPRSRDEVFAFFARPENLAVLTPDWLGFEMLTPSPVPMHAGAVIDYRIRLGPLPVRWRTLITAFEPPRRFVDEQLLGPYSYWHHVHTFDARDGGTLISDRVTYLMPLGALGRLAHGLFVGCQLDAIFGKRRQEIDRRFGADDQEAGE
jgi:ligand-binding SRPBCC domain-containing protein